MAACYRMALILTIAIAWVKTTGANVGQPPKNMGVTPTGESFTGKHGSTQPPGQGTGNPVGHGITGHNGSTQRPHQGTGNPPGSHGTTQHPGQGTGNPVGHGITGHNGSTQRPHQGTGNPPGSHGTTQRPRHVTGNTQRPGNGTFHPTMNGMRNESGSGFGHHGSGHGNGSDFGGSGSGDRRGDYKDDGSVSCTFGQVFVLGRSRCVQNDVLDRRPATNDDDRREDQNKPHVYNQNECAVGWTYCIMRERCVEQQCAAFEKEGTCKAPSMITNVKDQMEYCLQLDTTQSCTKDSDCSDFMRCCATSCGVSMCDVPSFDDYEDDGSGGTRRSKMAIFDDFTDVIALFQEFNMDDSEKIRIDTIPSPENGVRFTLHKAINGGQDWSNGFDFGIGNGGSTFPNGNGNTGAQQPNGNGNFGGQNPNGNSNNGGMISNGNGNTGAQQPNGNGNTGAQQPNGNGNTGAQQPNGNSNTGAQQPNGNGNTGAQQPNGNGNTGAQQPNGNGNTGAQQPNGNGNTDAQKPDGNANTGAQQPNGNVNTGGEKSSENFKIRRKRSIFGQDQLFSNEYENASVGMELHPTDDFNVLVIRRDDKLTHGLFGMNVSVIDGSTGEVKVNHTVILMLMPQNTDPVYSIVNAGPFSLPEDGELVLNLTRIASIVDTNRGNNVPRYNSSFLRAVTGSDLLKQYIQALTKRNNTDNPPGFIIGLTDIPRSIRDLKGSVSDVKDGKWKGVPPGRSANVPANGTIKITPFPEFTGTIRVTITPYQKIVGDNGFPTSLFKGFGQDMWTGNSTIIEFNVIDQNDAPEVLPGKQRALSAGKRQESPYACPFDPNDNEGIRVSEAIEYYFYDSDGGTSGLGMAVLMAQTSEKGKFQYKPPGGTWTDIVQNYTKTPLFSENLVKQLTGQSLSEVMSRSAADFENVNTVVPALLLGSDYMIRYNATVDTVWKVLESFQFTNIHFTAWDGTDNRTAEETVSIPMPVCVPPACGGSSSISMGYISLYIHRLGCDGKPGSRAVNDRCGKCGGNDKCMDCSGVPNGGAKFDRCGDCAGGNTGRVAGQNVDCGGSCDGIYTQGTHLCLPTGINEAAKISSLFCDGVFGSRAKRNKCGVCSTNPNEGKDRCGKCFGFDECVDCNNVTNGNSKIDACGLCLPKDDPNFDTGCAELGKLVPEKIYLETGKDAGLLIWTSRNFPSTHDLVSCSFKDTNINLLNTTKQTFNGRIVIDAKVPRSTIGGTYKVTCVFIDIGGSTVTKTGVETVRVVPSTTVTSLAPNTMKLRERNMKVNITGTNFADTGFIQCFAKCPEKFDARECRSSLPIIRFPARRLSSQLVECDLKRAVGVRQASSFELGVLLKWPRAYEIPGLSTGTFTITAPKPVMVSAAFHSKTPCTIRTFFDMNIEPHRSFRSIDNYWFRCLDIFDNSTSHMLGKGSLCMVTGKRVMLFLGDSPTIQIGSNMTLRDDAIFSLNAEVPNYAAGGATVAAPSDMTVPTPRLISPPEIGSCDSFVVKARIRIALCDNIVYNWTVAVGPNQNTTGTDAENSASTLQTRLSSITDENKLTIAGNELTPGFSYVFSLWVTNILGFQSQVGQVATRRSQDVKALFVNIRGGDRTDVLPTSRHILSSRIVLSKCTNVSLSDVLIMWEGASDTGQSVTPQVISKKNAVVLPGGMLGGRTYDFTVSVVLNNDFSTQFTDTVQWTTMNLALIAKISGSKLSDANVNNDLVIDASGSKDPNNPGGEYDQDTTFSWGCKVINEDTAEETGDCFATVNGTVKNVQSILPTQAEITVTANMLDPGVYKFTVTMRNGQRTASDFVYKNIKEFQDRFPLPEISFIERKNEKENPSKALIVSAAITYSGEADNIEISWQSVQDEGYDMLDFANCVADSGTVQLGGGSKENYQTTLVYNAKGLEECNLCPSCLYKIRLIITISHSDLESELMSSSETDVEMYGAPSGGSFKLSSLNGTAFETAITVSSENWDSTSINTKVFNCPTSTAKIADCSMQGLPTTGETKDLLLAAGDHNVRVVACNAEFICTESDNFPVKIEEAQGNDAVLQYLENMEEQSKIGDDVTGQLSAISEFGKSSNDSTLKAKVFETTNALIATVMQTTDPKSDPVSALDTLSSTETIDLSADNKATKATTMNDLTEKLEASTETTTSGGNRRRRAVSSQTQLSSLDVEDVETLLVGYSTTVDESSDRATVEPYLKNVHKYMKGICRGMSTGMTLYATDDKHISLKMDMRLFGNIANVSLTVPCDNCTAIVNPASVSLGESMQDMFTSWNCSDALNCYGGCLATSQLPNSILSINTTAISPLSYTRRSDVVGVHFINPEANKYQDTEPFAQLHLVNLTHPMRVKIPISGIVNDTLYSMQCHKWSYVNDWTTDECTSSDPFEENGVNYVTCSCSSLGYVAVYEAPPITTTAAPTTVATTTTETPTTQAAVTTAAQSTSDDTADKVEVSFKLDANYSAIVGSNKSGFISLVTTQLATKLNVEESRIANMDVQPGSIIVSFDLMPPASGSGTKSSAALSTLRSSITGGTLTIVDGSGNTLAAITNSLVVAAVTATNSPTTVKTESTKPKGMNLGIIIGASVGGLFGIVAIVVIIVVVCSRMKARSKRVGASPSSSQSSVRMTPTSRQSSGNVRGMTPSSSKNVKVATVDETALYDNSKPVPDAYDYYEPVGSSPTGTQVPTALDATTRVTMQTENEDQSVRKRGSQASLSSTSSGKGRMMVTNHGAPVYDAST